MGGRFVMIWNCFYYMEIQNCLSKRNVFIYYNKGYKLYKYITRNIYIEKY